MSMPSLADLRREYSRAGLSESDADADPFRQFQRWLEEAIASGAVEPTAMNLATVAGDGQPSTRVVLLKALDERGFVFYTNYGSRKAIDLEGNPKAGLCFFWAELERQVRVEGTIEKVSRQESDTYFHQRPRQSQLAAWASMQSSPLPSRESLESQYNAREAEFEGKEVPLPPNWGGYRVIPHYLEFWQGRRNRLHDRLVYSRHGDGWMRSRVSP
jgi:pyridoxamine 5'-phosphate oxidase